MMERDIKYLLELVMDAWVVISNAGNGWTNVDPEWRKAAAHWRDRFHTALDVYQEKL